MNYTSDEYSTQTIKPQLVEKIINALKNKAYGSVEIYIENFSVTQITERTITKVRSHITSRKKYIPPKTNKRNLRFLSAIPKTE